MDLLGYGDLAGGIEGDHQFEEFHLGEAGLGVTRYVLLPEAAEDLAKNRPQRSNRKLRQTGVGLLVPWQG